MSAGAISLALVALLVGGILGAVVVRALRSGRPSTEPADAIRALDARLDVITGELNRTFAQALHQATQSLNGTIGSVRDEARAVREETRTAIQQQSLQVARTLGDLTETNNRILEQSRSLDEFQRMLQSPKLRGDFGEFTLEQMLRDLLPAESYECQAPIGNGRVDALIRTPHGALCIDCKFPLDNFRRALQATEAAARDSAMKSFYSDVRGRINEIADRYVLPPQTLEVAFMFVPSENVYYEVIGRPEILSYGRERNVVPVSPNTMYAYIQALAVGFRGMKIQEEAKRVQQIIAQLGTRFDRFQDHFNMVGKHLDNAKSQFERAMRDVERFDATLQGVKIGRLEETQPPLAEESRPSTSRGEPLLYLVHHGDAVNANLNPMRPLSERGLAEVNALSGQASARGARPAMIRHSGKLRARQTAEVYWRCCNPLASFSACHGLQPTDPTGWIIDAIAVEAGDLMLVGHFPHLPRLLGRLLSGRADAPPEYFPLHGVVALDADAGRWVEKWRLNVPDDAESEGRLKPF